MKSDFFNRPTRMVHRFGDTERLEDPLGTRTFTPPAPLPGAQRRSPPCEVQEYGEHRYRTPVSAVQKPSGAFASINGPEPDLSGEIGRPISSRTCSRKP